MIRPIALTLLLALPAAAQDAPKDAIDAVLAPAFAAQTVFLTCAALSPTDYATVSATWAQTMDRVTKTLTDGGIPADRIAALTAAGQPPALTLPDSTPFGDIRALCAANEGWMMAASSFNTIQLIRDLKDALPQ